MLEEHENFLSVPDGKFEALYSHRINDIGSMPRAWN
jgi:hypothetical protein